MTAHTVTFDVLKRPCGLDPIHQYACTCGARGKWTPDRTHAHQQGNKHQETHT